MSQDPSAGSERRKSPNKRRRALLAALSEQGPITLDAARSATYWDGGKTSNFQRDHLDPLVASQMLARIAAPRSWSRQQLIGFGPAIGCVLAIAASTTRVRAALLDANLRPVGSAVVYTYHALVSPRADGDPDATLRAVTSAIASTVERLYTENRELTPDDARWQTDQPIPTGIALPVAVHQETGQVTDRYAQHFDVAKHLQTVWPKSVAPPFDAKRTIWSTDVAAAGLGYMRMHRDFDHKNVLVVKVSGWIRHAFIVDNSVVRGAANRGHAFGRVASPPDGAPELAGGTGDSEPPPRATLDDHASLRGLRSCLEYGHATRPEKPLEAMDRWATKFFDGAQKEGTRERTFADHAADRLGGAIRDALCLMDPDAVLLTGHAVKRLGPGFARRVEDRADLGERSLFYEVDPEIRPFHPSSTLVGAGLLALRVHVLEPKAEEFRRQFDQPDVMRKSSTVNEPSR